MLKRTITYTDYNGEERTEDFFFNLTKAEIIELELSVSGGLENLLDTIIKTKDAPKIIENFKKIILKAYGVKSADGRRFIKNDEVRDDFAQTEAYSILFTELATDADAAAKFVNGIVPEQPKETPATIAAAH